MAGSAAAAAAVPLLLRLRRHCAVWCSGAGHLRRPQQRGRIARPHLTLPHALPLAVSLSLFTPQVAADVEKSNKDI